MTETRRLIFVDDAAAASALHSDMQAQDDRFTAIEARLRADGSGTMLLHHRSGRTIDYSQETPVEWRNLAFLLRAGIRNEVSLHVVSIDGGRIPTEALDPLGDAAFRTGSVVVGGLDDRGKAAFLASHPEAFAGMEVVDMRGAAPTHAPGA